MKIIGDYHTHTKASDGHTTVEENVSAAKALGLEQIAVTDHSFSSILCHMTKEKFDAQQKVIDAFNREGEIRVLHGVEGNLQNWKGEIDVPLEIIRRCDVLHLGFHRFLQPHVWKGAFGYLVINGFFPSFIRRKLIEKNTQAYLLAMERYPIDVLVHLNHRAIVDTKTVCRFAAEKGIYVELNGKHLKTIEPCINEVLASGVKLILGTDAHRLKDVGDASNILEFMVRHNIPADRVYGMGRLPEFKDKSNFVDL